MKIQLFYPRTIVGCGAHNDIYWPLTLLNITAYVKNYLHDIEINIWDGELYPNNDDLIKKLDHHTAVVGVSCTSFNYPHALEIAKEAESNGSEVIFGGLHATYYGETILKNRPYVHAVIYDKGEKAFLQYLTIKDKSKVQNLIWRDGKKIRKNSLGKRISLDELPSLDYSLLELEKYFENHKKIYPDFPDKPMSAMTHEGCPKRDKYGPCSFCSITSSLYFRDTKKFWNFTSKAVEDYGFNYVKDWGDSLTGNKQFLEQLISARPKSLKDLSFSVYDNLSDINQDAFDFLKKLKVKMIFAAIESANNEILRKMNKQTTKEQMYKAIKLISKNNIPIFTSYVLGERGETRKTLDETLKFAQDIREISDVRVSNGSPMAILPGSPNFERLVQKFPELKNQDLLDLTFLREIWTKHFCPDIYDYKIIEEYAEKIGKLGDHINRYGWNFLKK